MKWVEKQEQHKKYENGKISGKFISSLLALIPLPILNMLCWLWLTSPEQGHIMASIVASPYAKEIF